jgi:beta-glucanase (GH16 family)
MSQLPIGTILNPSGATRVLGGATSGLKVLSFRPGGAWPATNSGVYPLGTPALNTMTQWIAGYASGAWGSPLSPGTPPTGYEAGVYYPQLSTLPGNYEAEVYFNADAMKYLGGPPVITLDGNSDVVITPRLQTVAEAAFAVKTAALTGQPQIGKTLFTSGAFCTYPYSIKPPFVMGARVKMPVPMAQGLWPSVWLLPASLQWPPEIDAIEYIETNGAIQLTSSVHDAALSSTDVISNSGVNPQDGLAHDFWAMVYPDYITIFYDGKAVANFATPVDIATAYFYLIIDYAIAGVGNTWPGPVAPGTTSFPPMTVVDVVALEMPVTYETGATMDYVAPNGSSPVSFSTPSTLITLTPTQLAAMKTALSGAAADIASVQTVLGGLG